MKLYGKELDAELLKRKQIRQARIDQRISAHNAARTRGISVSELLNYESGRDVCPHEEWEDSSDFHFRFVFQTCKKCRTVKNHSMEKEDDSNMDRVFEIYKEAALKASIQENKDLEKK